VRKYGCIRSQDSILSIVTKIMTGRSGRDKEFFFFPKCLNWS